jgi:hypothetical protein
VLSARIRHFLKRLIVLGLSSALGVTAFVYAVDYAVFRYRVAANRHPFGQVTVTNYDAVQQKSGKTAGPNLRQRLVSRSRVRALLVFAAAHRATHRHLNEQRLQPGETHSDSATIAFINNQEDVNV